LNVFVGTVVVNASENIIIENADIVKVDNNLYILPINISNNPGLMGFKMNISYGDGIAINSISRGDVTSKGNFSDNHLYSNDGNAFSVLWNNTEEIKSAGTLFFIGFSVIDDSVNDINFSITYSEQDTFNEEYENVILSCSNIKIKLREAMDYESYSHQNNSYIDEAVVDSYVGTMINSIDYKAVVKSVDDVMLSKPIEDASEEEIQKIVDKVTELVLCGSSETTNKKIDNKKVYEAIKEIYKRYGDEANKLELDNVETTNQEKDYFHADLIKKELHKTKSKIIICMSLIGVIIMTAVLVIKARKDKKL
jgi:flagellar biosynthesis regulator FlbT